jgi:hypothetical protein
MKLSLPDFSAIFFSATIFCTNVLAESDCVPRATVAIHTQAKPSPKRHAPARHPSGHRAFIHQARQTPIHPVRRVIPARACSARSAAGGGVSRAGLIPAAGTGAGVGAGGGDVGRSVAPMARVGYGRPGAGSASYSPVPVGGLYLGTPRPLAAGGAHVERSGAGGGSGESGGAGGGGATPPPGTSSPPSAPGVPSVPGFPGTPGGGGGVGLPVAAVPEPAAWAVMLLGTAAIGVAARRSRRLAGLRRATS